MSALYRTYRPRAWADVVGQEHVTKALAWQVANGRQSHAYLFAGPRGVGKTTCARILARAVNCPARAEGSGEPCGECANCKAIQDGGALDVIEIDAASNRGIDVVREVIIENARFAPSSLPFKVFVLDEAHMLTTEAWNALLKTLEEPSGKTVFILATTELHKVPATVQSRCQRYDFARLSESVLAERLSGLCAKEGVAADERVIRAIAKAADGCARDAESLLGQALTAARDGKLAYDDAASVLPLADADSPRRFVLALAGGDAAAALAEVAELSRRGSDLAAFHDAAAAAAKDGLAWALAGTRAFPGADTRDAGALAELAAAGAPRLGAVLRGLLDRRRLTSVAPDRSLPLALVVAELTGTVPPVASVPPTPPPAPVARPLVAAAAPAVVPAVPATTPAPAPTEKAEAAPAPVAVAASETKAVASEPVAAAVPSGPPVIDVAAVQAKWPTLVNKVAELQPSLSFILVSGKPSEVVGDMVRYTVGFPFHRDKANQDKNRLAIEKAFLAVYGVTVRVEASYLEQSAPVGHDHGAAAEAQAAPASSTVANLEAVFG